MSYHHYLMGNSIREAAEAVRLWQQLGGRDALERAVEDARQRAEQVAALRASLPLESLEEVVKQHWQIEEQARSLVASAAAELQAACDVSEQLQLAQQLKSLAVAQGMEGPSFAADYPALREDVQLELSRAWTAFVPLLQEARKWIEPGTTMAELLDEARQGRLWFEESGVATLVSQYLTYQQLALSATRAGLITSDRGILCGGDSRGLVFTAADHASGRVLRPTVWSSRKPVAGSPRQNLVVTCRVVCSLCGDSSVLQESTCHLSSSEEIREFSVLPLCPNCLDRVATDPSYMDAMIAELFSRQPITPYKLVRGGGQGDSPPRGRETLRLVELRSEELDDEDPEV